MAERTYDALILGCGPAGMAAAVRATELGLRIAVIDEQPAPGGQVWRNVEHVIAASRAAPLGNDYAQGIDLVNAFRRSGVDYFSGTTVWQVEPGYRVYTCNDEGIQVNHAPRLLIATGAMERPVPFPRWTLPGVMTVGAAQILLKSADQIPDEPVWFAGCGPLLLLYANQLLDAGGRIGGMLDTQVPRSRRGALGLIPDAIGGWREIAKGMGWTARLRSARVVRGVQSFEAFGEEALEGIRYRTRSGTEGSVQTKLLLVHEGVIPDIHLTLALGCRHRWIDAQQCFAPELDDWGETSMHGVFVAGDAGGIGGAAAARAAGEIAGLALARAAGRLNSAETAQHAVDVRKRLAASLSLRPLLDALYTPRPPTLADDTVVCRCESVTAGEIRTAIREGAREPNYLKAQTRCGMGPCMGRQCGTIAARLIAEANGESMERTGLARVRPPLRSITLSQLASLARTQP